MALTDKNIVITPNIGQTADPSIVFSGADTSTAAQNITMRVYPTNNGTLSFEGSNGQIFSINNNFTGTIFSVNDISGIPSIEVLDTGEIRMAQYSGYVRVMSTVAATTVTSGALQVSGGVGVNGDLYARNIYTNGQLVGAVATGSNNLLGGTAGAIPYQESPGTTKFISIGTSGWVLGSNGSTATYLNPVSLTVARSTTATTLSYYAAGYIPIQTTAGTSYIQPGTFGDVLLYGPSPSTTATWTNPLALTVGRSTTSTFTTDVLGGANGNLIYQAGANDTQFVALGTAGNILVSGGAASPIWQNTLTLAGTTNATSTGTGALVVAGGIGVAKDLWVGGTLYATVQGSINTASNIANGTAGAIVYQTAVGRTGFIGIGLNGNILQSNGTSATWVTTSSMVVGAAVSAAGTANLTGGAGGSIPYQSSAGITTFVGIGANGSVLYTGGTTPAWTATANLIVGSSVLSTTATHIAGGAAGAIHYQTAAGRTDFIGIGPTGYVLQSNGTTATWLSPGALVTSSTQNISGGSTGSIAYQVANGVTGFINIGSNGTLLRSNGTTATWVTTSTVMVDAAITAYTATRATNIAGTVSGGGMLHYQLADNDTKFLGTGTAGTVLVSRPGAPQWSNTLNLAGTTAATNSTTGALVVAGGVGVGGDLYIGGVLYATVQGSINTATNISGGVAGDLLYQSGAGATAKLAIGTVGRVLTSSGTAPQWVTTGSLYVQDSYRSQITTNLNGGANGSIPYQTAANATSFLAIGAAGSILQSNGTTAAWVTTGSLVAGVSQSAVNLAGGAQYQIPYQSAVGATTFSANLTFNGTALTVGGAATAASFIPSNASIPSNGLYLPSANSIGLATNSTNRLTVDSAGLIGMGTAPATHRLTVSGTAYATSDMRAPRFYDSDNTAYYADPAGTSILANLLVDNIFGNTKNYATSQGWSVSANTVQTGYYGGNFGLNGDGNSIAWGVDPFGRRGLLWLTRNNDVASDGDGGWDKAISGLQPNEAYMSVVYIRRSSASVNGSFYHGCDGANTLNLNGTVNSNPYFHTVNIGVLPQDVWCVSIGFIQANNDPNTVNTNEGGIYRLDTGQQITVGTDYKMGAGTSQSHRTFMYYSTDPAASLDWWGPGFYEMNGTEPSIDTLTGNNNNGWGRDWYAPIYYDSNDQNYYINGNGVSNLNSLNVGLSSSAALRALTVGGGDISIIGQGGATPLSFISVSDSAGNNGAAGTLYLRGLAGNGATQVNLASIYAMTTALYCSGDVYSSYSDINLKTVLGNIEDPLAMVRKIETFYYEPNETALKLGVTPGRKVGVSAQSVQTVVPEAVGPSALNSEYLTVQYERLVPLLIESIKKLEDEINQLKEQLKGKV